MSNFKIKGVGIDTTKLDYAPSEEFEFNYVFTSITANNEVYVKNLSKYAQIVTYINFLDKSDEAIREHLDLLDRDSIALLLIDANCDFIKYADTINSCIDLGYVEEVGIYGPTSIERVKEIQEVLPSLRFVGLEFSPLNFNYELISWMVENNLELIGFNPFGGHISAAGMIDAFSVPYLLEFSSAYSTLLFLSGRDIFTAEEDKGYVMQLVDEEMREDYSLNKSVSKLYTPMKKVVGMSLNLTKSYTLPIDNPAALFDPSEVVIKLGPAVYEVEDAVIELGSVEDKVYRFYEDFKTPYDTDSDLAIISLIKSKIITILRNEYNSGEDEWEITMTKVADHVFIINLTKPIIKGKLFKRLKGMDTINYLLAVYNKSLEFCRLVDLK